MSTYKGKRRPTLKGKAIKVKDVRLSTVFPLQQLLLEYHLPCKLLTNKQIKGFCKVQTRISYLPYTQQTMKRILCVILFMFKAQLKSCMQTQLRQIKLSCKCLKAIEICSVQKWNDVNYLPQMSVYLYCECH